MIFERDPHRLFGVPRTHGLELVRRTVRDRSGRRREVRWFAETDAAGRGLARYRCWDEGPIDGGAGDGGAGAPSGGARELGWERYGPRGELLDREVRRAPRAHEAVAVH